MILIVDDDKSIRLSLGVLLKRAGYEAMSVAMPDEALEVVRHQPLELILMDMNFTRATSGEEGITLLRQVKIFQPEVPVILITAWGSIPLAVEGMHAGAFDFMTKPWNNQVLLQRVETALSLTASANKKMSADLKFDRSAIIGRSKELNDILETVERVAPTDASVLILGENGTGKELIARAIHNNSHRRENPLVMVNLGGVSHSLFDSEMFGHAKGAFTGAVSARKGRFELADKGTIFLDEIGDLDLSCQVKLLRVLQQHTFEPLGDNRTVKVDIRVVCATNADIPSMVRERTFREDLYYRINLITIHLPALRDRRPDIPLLVDHFMLLTARAHGVDVPEVASDAMSYLTKLPYPGNIRELKNIVERTLIVNKGKKTLSAGDFRTSAEAFAVTDAKPKAEAFGGGTLEDMEREAIVRTLEKYSGNLAQSALALGVSRQSLYRRMQKYGLGGDD